MKNKIIKMTVLAVILITILSGCASMKLMKTAENKWNKGDILGSLLNATYALQEKNSNTKAQEFLAQRYNKGISLIEDEISSMNSMNEPQRSVKMVKYYKGLIELNHNMDTFIYPFTDKKNTFNWTPIDIKDFSSQLTLAKESAANGFLAIALQSTEIASINKNGKEALTYALESTTQNKIKKSVTELFYSLANKSINNGTESDLLYALKALLECTNWTPGYKNSEKLKSQVKTTLASIYYNQAIKLSSDTSSRTELKEAITVFAIAQKWIPNYKDSNEKVLEIKERLALYLFVAFNQKSYSLVQSIQNIGTSLPNDIRGLYLSQLNKELKSEHNFKFSKKTSEGSLSTVLHPYILEIVAEDYGTPPFINAAQKAGLSYMVVLKISSGNNAGGIKINSSMETKQRKIKRYRAKISYYNVNQQLITQYSDPPNDVVLFLKTLNAKSDDNVRGIFNKFGSDIPSGVIFKYNFISINDSFDYQAMVERYSYPVVINAELISIENKNIVKKTTITKDIEGIKSQYFVKALKNKEFYDSNKDLSKQKKVLLNIDDSLITDAVIKLLFSKVNSDFIPYLNKID